MIEPTNRFTIDLHAHINHAGAGVRPVLQWLNLQHVGRPTMPLEEVIGEQHRKSHENVHMGRLVRLTIEVDREGDWKLIDAELL